MVRIEDIESQVDEPGGGPQIDYQNFRASRMDPDLLELISSEPSRIAASIEVKIAGGVQFSESLRAVAIDQYLDSHHRASVSIHLDNGSDAFQSLPGKVGEQLSIDIAENLTERDKPRVTFNGIITEVRLDSTADRSMFATLIAESPTISMDQAKVSRSFESVKISDVISSVVGSGSVPRGDVNVPQTPTFDKLFQYRETDFAFLHRLAALAGAFAYYDGERLNVHQASASGAVTVSWEDVGKVKLGLGVRGSEITTHGWDYKQKQAIVGEATGNPRGSSPGNVEAGSLRKSEELFSEKDQFEAFIARDQAAADTFAQQYKRDAVRKLVTAYAQGRVFGIKIGGCVKFENMGSMDGDYHVTFIRHSFAEGGYSSAFRATPLNVSFPGYQSRRPRETSLQIGIVVDNEDPEDLGRVKVKYPWLPEEQSFWARVLYTDASSDKGLYTIPDIEDEVLVGFQFDDPDLPIILGNLYNGVDKPIRAASEAIKDGKVVLKTFLTRQGNLIEMDDSSGKETISVSQQDGKNKLIMTLDGPKITIESEGDIAIKGKTVSLEATNGDVSMKASGKVKSESTADTEIKATGVFKCEGMNVEVKGQTAAKVEGGANLELKGGAMVKVQGGMINLN